MLLRWIEADGFLSFGQRSRLTLGLGLTVVTGPNGAGKSNLGRCLDLARSVLAGNSDPEADRLHLYQDAGYEGAEEFTVRLGIELDQQWERDLVRAYVRACFATAQANQNVDRTQELDAAVTNWLEDDTLAPLWSGTLVIQHRMPAARPWSAAWQFSHAGVIWHAVLAGDDGIQQLRPGTAEDPAEVGGARMFTDWLLDTKPQDGHSLDFRLAMQDEKQPVTFTAHTGTSRPGWVSASVRDLGTRLGLDPDGRMFSFDRVIALVLQRGITLTDNRRLPLRRRFTITDLSRPADLRDGAEVAAELFRLKNGDPQDRERFRKIQTTFTELTGRNLEVRAQPAPPDDRSDNPGYGELVIEPTVTGQHGERLAELSGAGIQEALVLSTLLGDSPGRMTVLDEPAVNLEPTVQRRLTSRIRSPGQYLVITHNADLVPFEEDGDLERIARVAPGPSGSEIHQPDFSDLRRRDQIRQLQLVEPAEVRSLLFARAVIVCEGETEIGALPRWWRTAPDAGLPDPATANIAFISVSGHSGYGKYIRFLDAYAIPWAIITDGPALRHTSKLAHDLQEQGHWPAQAKPQNTEDFAMWRRFWNHAGVFTLANQFGDDGSKGGELEALLRQLDSDLLDHAMRETGGSKPRAGRYFAVYHPAAPPAVLDLYKQVVGHLGLS